MSYGKGLKRPDTHKLARRLHASFHPLLASAGTPRGSAQLVPCQRMDQGQSGTCHAHSAAAAVWTARNALGSPLAFVPSPLLIAACTYADVQGPASKRGPLQDTGADLSDDATALSTWGIAPMGPTVDGRYSDVPNDPPDNSFPEPDLLQLQVAGADIISGEYQIPVDASAPTLCALALDANVPIWLGFEVDDAFQALGPGDVALPPVDAPDDGGHAVYLSGYERDGASGFAFRLENSWGSGWADGGAVWVSQAWLLATWMLWPMAVSP